jgi:hypothetical protein
LPALGPSLSHLKSRARVLSGCAILDYFPPFNIRRCTGLPVAKNSRGERARDWQAIDEDKGSGSDVIMVDTGS